MEDIYWDQFCGSQNQYSAFWSNNLTVDTSNPDFTQCFQDTVFVWVPCGFLWLCSLFYIPSLKGKPVVNRCSHAGKLNLTKLVLSILLCFVVLMDFFKTVGEISSHPPHVYFVAPSVYFITFALSAFLISYEFRKGILSSGVLFLFWFLLLLTGIVSFRSKIIQLQQVEGVSVFKAVTFFIYFAFVVLEFILHLWADTAALPDSRLISPERQPLLSDQKTDKEDSNENRKPCPELKSSFLMRLTFGWITKLVITGYRRPLEFKDLTKLLPEESCAVIVPRFLREWNKEMMKIQRTPVYKYTASGTSLRIPDDDDTTYGWAGERTEPVAGYSQSSSSSQPSLTKALVRTFGAYFAYGGFMNLIYTVLTFVNPLLLDSLITFIESNDPFVWRGYLYGVLMFVTSLLRTLIMQQYWDSCFRTGLRTRSAIIAAVYRKSLKLSNGARKNTTVGEIVNLMSVDAQKMQDVPAYLHMLWVSPLTIAIALVFLWYILGPSSLAGLAVMVLLVPVNGFLATKIRLLQVAQMKYKDTRLKIMSEVLNGMKVLKMYAWEPSFQRKIEEIRNKELKVLKKAAYLNASASISWFCAPYLVALASFATFVLSDPGNILDANTAFVSLNLFAILNYPLSILPQTIVFTVQAVVSVARIGRFLKEDEVDPNSVERSNIREHAVSVDNASFAWGKKEVPILRNIDIHVDPGSLVAVVGQVGSGKSSLIEAIMGEMDRLQGTVNVKGSVAYVAQQAWIQNQTVKNNILFGKKLNETLYKKCLSSCALEPDLKILPGGDQTEIGEKGINLSGGQKQRVSVARAVYQDCDVYLLDDPLSAVDSHVGKHIFNEVIGPQGMLKSKTRILCTNSISCLPKVDKIIVLSSGEISEIGTYQELLSHNGAFSEFIKTYLNAEEESSESEDDEETSEMKAQLRRQISILSGEESGGDSELERGKSPFTSSGRKKSRARTTSRSKSVEESLHIKRESKVGVKLIQDEFAETGTVSFAVIVAYMKALGMVAFFTTVFSYIGFVGCMIGSNIWLNIWSNDQVINNTQDRALTDLRLGVYGALGGGQALFVLIESLSIATGCICASDILHSGILKCIMKTPMAFFDTTPLGRIVNRFSKDMDTVDITIPMTMRIFLATLASVISTLVVITYSTPLFIVVIVPLGILYYFVQRFYVATVRQLQRIDSLKRSPIYSHFGETIVGASSIRAFRQQERFIQTTDRMVDENQMAWFPYITSNRWLGVGLETIGSFIVLFASLFAVIARESDAGITSGEVGLSVSFALQVTASLNYMVRMSCDFETQIVAVERIKEYSELDSEAPWDLNHNRPPPEWPQQGKVVFNQFSLRYRPGLDLVLRDINCEVHPGEKVGIVGRTGAGKSSLTLALFRIIEAAAGSIVIDGINIADLGLHQLRQKVTIIPQDPVLFSGTLRMNLDPFDQYTDNDIWNALEHSHLKGYVSSLPQLLEHECTEGGENLSVGQRQLVCLGRALLRKTKILVLDEATAAVDMETDDLIQSTIRTEFKECTVLTIAHRLNTIMDYDRVLVLDGGALKEYDTPSALLMNKKSMFYGMARDAGLV